MVTYIAHLRNLPLSASSESRIHNGNDRAPAASLACPYGLGLHSCTGKRPKNKGGAIGIHCPPLISATFDRGNFETAC